MKNIVSIIVVPPSIAPIDIPNIVTIVNKEFGNI